ncbi:KTSC domain-containing protein [Bradyrhizobium yuanmingense]|uniref:KTSC domain-containing protein n=1 Tax=Bradyrhizobium yuanmingense TaxID=108015 RepID=UPI0012FCAD0B|nr:KTSC domain-containing protein [Bradyrhizobium yuanmingense]MVT55363.1 KTSC domain-containing protein [Bradyrhizobium yuanmingense]
MDYVRVRSSTVSAVGYDEDARVLGVQYLNGSEYHYFAVPKAQFEGLKAAASVGSYLNAFIKDAGFRFKRVR